MEPGPFVYHGAPANLVGRRLVSLYALEALDPAAFRKELSKYAGRESAPEFVRVPMKVIEQWRSMANADEYEVTAVFESGEVPAVDEVIELPYAGPCRVLRGWRLRPADNSLVGPDEVVVRLDVRLEE